MKFQSFIKKSLGSKRLAEKIYQRAQRGVPAYKQFLETQGIKARVPFNKLPLSDKKSYALAYPFEELLADDADKIYAIARSSGSSGNSFYWPILKSNSRFVGLKTRIFLERTFAVHKKKTLAIVGLSLGSSLGGVSFSWALNNMAANTPYPFWVFCPGIQQDDIIEMICKMNPFVDQIILLIVPSAIAHLHLKASEQKRSLPLEKLRYIVIGEPFPESIRTSLQNRAGIAEDIPFMFSMYASADTGGLGTESLASIALRKLLYRNQKLANSLGLESPIPHFFHFIASDTFVELVDGHFCVTRWQGIPLVRYILYDRVALYNWRKLRKAILISDKLDSQDEALVKIIAKSSPWLPNILAVTGRSDSCLILLGTNLTEYMLDAAVKCEELNDILTGLYRARILYEEDQQYLEFDLEVRQGVTSDEAVSDRVYYSLVKTLGQVQPEFLDDWKRVFSAWDNVPNKRILRLNFLPWPNLSQNTEKTIKQRGIVTG
ncbi:hypothetical protein [Coleofasciculus sp. FACHB-T130]|uniref:hypothetical protein n=1 Tax=Cyanophyceae TaxID=3028117 RepID=UPI001688D6BB|nr:hypothetical protein [Coleofasciculus sp. FACHB-T130]MBD1882017.1 hypothetical protein [Coleofasciculus sp. FACHB-T130]